MKWQRLEDQGCGPQEVFRGPAEGCASLRQVCCENETPARVLVRAALAELPQLACNTRAWQVPRACWRSRE